MKAITISQPYASLIADGFKFIENRTWPTSYRGPIAIHAGKGTQYLNKQELAEYPAGCIVAMARLSACVTLKSIRERDATPCRHDLIEGTLKQWSDAARHIHAEGPFCWILEDIKKLDEPIPATGKQGLWEWKEQQT